jgi:hypothetical protein
VLVAIAALIVLSGLIVILGRSVLDQDESAAGNSLVRSWIAISLVGGLLVFCVVALTISDASLRSTLFGGLVTTVGAAVAYYFSSQGADKARQDLMAASLGSTEVPNLVGQTVQAAKNEISETALRLESTNPNALPTDQIVSQSVAAGTSVTNGTKISVDARAVG